MSEILEQLERLIEPALSAESIELVDLSYQKGPRGWTLCFFLDKAGGITLSDCETWSDRLGELIDQSNVIDRSYVLEVSSPGLDRPLRKPTDFQKFAGERVSVKLYAALNGQKNFHGQLQGGDENEVRVKLDDGRDMIFQRSHIAKCKLDPIIKI